MEGGELAGRASTINAMVVCVGIRSERAIGDITGENQSLDATTEALDWDSGKWPLGRKKPPSVDALGLSNSVFAHPADIRFLGDTELLSALLATRWKIACWIKEPPATWANNPIGPHPFLAQSHPNPGPNCAASTVRHISRIKYCADCCAGVYRQQGSGEASPKRFLGTAVPVDRPMADRATSAPGGPGGRIVCSPMIVCMECYPSVEAVS